MGVLYLLLAILKFLGWFFVLLIGILVFLILLILFVPIRYKFEGEYGKRKKGMFQCSWLFYLLFFRVSMEQEQIKYLFKILGITFYPKKEKNQKKKREKKIQTNPIAHISNREKEGQITQDKNNFEKKLEQKENTEKSDKIKGVEKNCAREKEQIEERYIENNENTIKQQEHPFFIKKIGQWIKKIFFAMKGFAKKIFFIAKNWKKKKEKIQRFLKNEKTKKAYRDSKTFLKKLLKHIIPRKLKGEVQFGLEDPSQTGEVLGILSLCLPVYKENVRIIPYFEQKKLEVNLYGKGKILVGYGCYILLRVWFHKEIRLTIKRAKKLLK